MVGHGHLENGKYYIPDLEDFCIGYKCEVCWSAGYTTDFDPFEVRIMDDDYVYTSDLDTLTTAAEDGYAYIRTKCLDREDIESLGWIYTRSYENNLHFETKDIWNVDIKGGFLEYNIGTKKLRITTKDGGYNSNGPNCSIKFNGECMSINELIKISKLIGV